MGFKKTYLSAMLPALAFLAGACSGNKNVNDPFVDFPDDGKLAKVVSVVTTPSTTDTVFSFDGRQVEALQIARIFPTEHSDVFFSIRVFPLKGESAVNMGLARIISEDFSTVAGGDVYYDLHETTARAVTEQIDYYGKVFNDTILPQLRESVVNGFYVNVDLRPAWVSADNEIYTYSSYMESCTGGAPAEISCYYVSFSTRLGRQMTFEDLVPAAERHSVREKLLAGMAKDAGMTEDDYLIWLTDYFNPEAEQRFTVDDFPVAYVALYNSGLVFSYPQGMVAPVSKGCPLYFI
ncbi:MAG: hypothetical protein K2L39_02160 [Muribaculaceae bacterium]|nr:hypothetical protein [Muribaculaceae bacterium]